MDNKKVKELMLRVYNNKMIEDTEKGISDEKDIKALCQKVFGDGSATPNPALLHDFNTVLVQTADQIAKPMATEMLSLFADFKTANPGTLYQYTVPAKSKARMKFTALGSGVDLVRVEGGKKSIAVPTVLSAGFYYEPESLVQDDVEYFRKLVNDVAEAKVRLYLTSVMKLIQTAITSHKIPTANVRVGSNLGIADYNKTASTISRVGNGGKVVFVADSLLIDYFANFQVSDTTISKLLTDSIKTELLTALVPTTIGRTTAINLVNPFTDETNSKVELPINTGYMFSSAVSQKPFTIVEYAGLKQNTETDVEDGRVKVMIKQEAAIELLFGEAIGVICEQSSSVSL
jgi:hypothetical protein